MTSPGFTRRYDVTRLGCYGGFELIVKAKRRQQAVKERLRRWTLNPIRNEPLRCEDL